MEDLIEQATPVVDDDDRMAIILDPNLINYNALSQAPYIITSMGHLLLISAEQDFSLREHLGNAKFQHIKFPDSFRACATQVSMGIWHAFEAAHNSMNRIYMKSQTIATNVKKAAELIKKGAQKESKNVEMYLQDSDKKCTECVETAASITNEFEKVASIMDELFQACTQSKGKYEEERKATSRKMEAARRKQEQIQQDKRLLEERCKQEKSEIEEAKQNYKNAVETYPAPWKIMLVGSIDGVAGFAHDIAIALLPAFLMGQGIPTGSSSTSNSAEPISPTPEISNDEANAYLAASDIFEQAKQLMFSESVAQDDIDRVITSLERMLRDLNVNAPKSNAEAVKIAKELCENGMQICNEIWEAGEQTIQPAVKDRIEMFYKKGRAFSNEAEYYLENLGPTHESGSDLKNQGFLTKTMLEDAEKKRREAKEMLLECYSRYERCYNQMLQESKEMENVLDELAKFDHRTIDLNKIRDALIKSMKALQMVIEHWKKFQNMFQVLHDVIGERLKGDVKRFVDVGNIANEELNYGQSITNITHQMIIQESSDAQLIARTVENVSGLYVEVSQRYLLDGVVRLQRIIPLDPSIDRAKMEEVRRELKNDMKEAQRGIRRIAEERKRDLGKKLDNLKGIEAWSR